MSTHPHLPVLFHETLELFAPLDEGIFVDCTLGYGGHAEGILKAHPALGYIGIDRDNEAIAYSTGRLAPFKERLQIQHGAYSQIIPTLKGKPVAGILADIGVSSLQLDKGERGFRFDAETLDMRMDQSRPFSAYDVVNGYSLPELEKLILEYGEERGYKKIAKAIVDARSQKTIESGRELASVIERIMPRRGGHHPATQTFQAIRIEVNDELGELERLLDAIPEVATPGMILGIITFHSLEDRIVKNRFKGWTRRCICPPEAFRCTCGNNHDIGRILTKKPLVAFKEEIRANVRSRSAKLRGFCFEKGQ